MLDTIKVKYAISPTEEQLEHWTKRITVHNSAARVNYVYNPKITDDEVMVKYTYYPIAYDENPMLTLEFSLPKLLFGNNFRMIGSIEGSIQMANLTLELVQYAPRVDLAKGILMRLDICYNHQVGDLVGAYLRAISKLKYPHRKTKYHKGEGVEFKSKHKTTKFYDKELEAGTADASGILRQETTILKTRNVKDFLGKKNPTLLDIDNDDLKFYLKTELSRLNLIDHPIPTHDQALSILSKTYGSMEGMYYYGLLVSKMRKTKVDIAADLDRHPRSLDRQLRKIVDAEIPLTMTDLETELPILQIP